MGSEMQTQSPHRMAALGQQGLDQRLKLTRYILVYEQYFHPCSKALRVSTSTRIRVPVTCLRIRRFLRYS